MLLLVLQSQLNQLGNILAVIGRQQSVDAGVHRLTPQHDLTQRRPGQQAALGPWVFVAHRVVVAVEQHLEGGVIGFEMRLKGFQHKGLEKPGDMGQMPFNGAGIGHGLRLAVFATERFRQPQALRAHAVKALGQQAGVGNRLLMGVDGHGEGPSFKFERTAGNVAHSPLWGVALTCGAVAQWRARISQGAQRPAALALQGRSMAQAGRIKGPVHHCARRTGQPARPGGAKRGASADDSPTARVGLRILHL